ncbi:unnamed protein product [Closterium sp. Yama58-4]|nr:unnamed protein product [Closterium sp. Yama58-4]
MLTRLGVYVGRLSRVASPPIPVYPLLPIPPAPLPPPNRHRLSLPSRHNLSLPPRHSRSLPPCRRLSLPSRRRLWWVHEPLHSHCSPLWSPNALAPIALAPNALASSALAPSALAPSALAPSALAPSALAPSALASNALAPSALAPSALAPSALAPSALAPSALAPSALAPSALAPSALAPSALAPSALAPSALAPSVLRERVREGVREGALIVPFRSPSSGLLSPSRRLRPDVALAISHRGPPLSSRRLAISSPPSRRLAISPLPSRTPFSAVSRLLSRRPSPPVAFPSRCFPLPSPFSPIAFPSRCFPLPSPFSPIAFPSRCFPLPSPFSPIAFPSRCFPLPSPFPFVAFLLPSPLISRRPSFSPVAFPLQSPLLSCRPSFSPVAYLSLSSPFLSRRPSSLASLFLSPVALSLSRRPFSPEALPLFRRPSSLPSYHPPRRPPVAPKCLLVALPLSPPTTHLGAFALAPKCLPVALPLSPPTTHLGTLPSPRNACSSPFLSPLPLPTSAPSRSPRNACPSPFLSPLLPPTSAPSRRPEMPARRPSSLPSHYPPRRLRARPEMPARRPSSLPSYHPPRHPPVAPKCLLVALPLSPPTTHLGAFALAPKCLPVALRHSPSITHLGACALAPKCMPVAPRSPLPTPYHSAILVHSALFKMPPFRLPPGFRFHPTDEELLGYYLQRKVENRLVDDGLIVEVDILKCEPWDLPSQSCLEAGEWYFFCARDKKYPHGSRANRATAKGYWKSTGKDKPVRSSRTSRQIGIKKTLVFYLGRAPRGERTDWVMHEYRLEPESRSRGGPAADYVLCRVFNKSAGAAETALPMDQDDGQPTASEPPWETGGGGGGGNTPGGVSPSGAGGAGGGGQPIKLRGSGAAGGAEEAGASDVESEGALTTTTDLHPFFREPSARSDGTNGFSVVPESLPAPAAAYPSVPAFLAADASFVSLGTFEPPSQEPGFPDFPFELPPVSELGHMEGGAENLMDILGLEEVDLVPVDPAAAPLVPVAAPDVSATASGIVGSGAARQEAESDVDVDGLWENIQWQAVPAAGAAAAGHVEDGAAHVAEADEWNIPMEGGEEWLGEQLPALNLPEGISIDDFLEDALVADDLYENHAALPAAPAVLAAPGAPVARAMAAPGGFPPAARAALRAAAPAPLRSAHAAGTATIAAAAAALAKAKAAQGAAAAAAAGGGFAPLATASNPGLAPMGATTTRALVRPRSRPVRAAGAVMPAAGASVAGRRVRMQVFNPSQLAGGSGGARLASSGSRSGAPSLNLDARPTPYAHAQARLAQADGSMGDEDCFMGAQEWSRGMDQHEGMVAATPVAATPIAATPVAATSIAATPIAAFDGRGLDSRMELSAVADVTMHFGVEDVERHGAHMTHHPAHAHTHAGVGDHAPATGAAAGAAGAAADGAFGGAAGPAGALLVVGQEEGVRILPVPHGGAAEGGAAEDGAVEGGAREGGAVGLAAAEPVRLHAHVLEALALQPHPLQERGGHAEMEGEAELAGLDDLVLVDGAAALAAAPAAPPPPAALAAPPAALAVPAGAADVPIADVPLAVEPLAGVPVAYHLLEPPVPGAPARAAAALPLAAPVPPAPAGAHLAPPAVLAAQEAAPAAAPAAPALPAAAEGVLPAPAAAAAAAAEAEAGGAAAGAVMLGAAAGRAVVEDGGAAALAAQHDPRMLEREGGEERGGVEGQGGLEGEIMAGHGDDERVDGEGGAGVVVAPDDGEILHAQGGGGVARVVHIGQARQQPLQHARLQVAGGGDVAGRHEAQLYNPLHGPTAATPSQMMPTHSVLPGGSAAPQGVCAGGPQRALRSSSIAQSDDASVAQAEILTTAAAGVSAAAVKSLGLPAPAATASAVSSDCLSAVDAADEAGPAGPAAVISKGVRVGGGRPVHSLSRAGAGGGGLRPGGGVRPAPRYLSGVLQLLSALPARPAHAAELAAGRGAAGGLQGQGASGEKGGGVEKQVEVEEWSEKEEEEEEEVFESRWWVDSEGRVVQKDRLLGFSGRGWRSGRGGLEMEEWEVETEEVEIEEIESEDVDVLSSVVTHEDTAHPDLQDTASSAGSGGSGGSRELDKNVGGSEGRSNGRTSSSRVVRRHRVTVATGWVDRPHQPDDTASASPLAKKKNTSRAKGYGLMKDGVGANGRLKELEELGELSPWTLLALLLRPLVVAVRRWLHEQRLLLWVALALCCVSVGVLLAPAWRVLPPFVAV